MLLQLFVDNTRPAMSKTSLDFVFFHDVKSNQSINQVKSIKIWRSGALFAFAPLHLCEPLRKQKVVVCDLWVSVFLFLRSKVSCFVFEKHRKFYRSSKIFFTCLHWAPRLARNCKNKHWYTCGAYGWSVGRTVTWLPNFLGLVDDHLFFAMGLH